MIEQEAEQRTEQWYNDKLGCVGCSTIDDVVAKPVGKSKEATTRRNLKAKLVCELLTGKRQEEFVSWDMKRGIELEPEAVMAYEIRKGIDTRTTGFVFHPTIKRAGASPDRLIGEDGVLEVKCPKLATHFEYLQAGMIPNEYRKQMLWEMACTGRKWVEFVSYHPDLPQHLQLFITRMERDDVLIAELEAEVIEFNKEVDAMVNSLKGANDGQ